VVPGLADAVLATADLFRLAEIKGKNDADVKALTADAAADWKLEEEQTADVPDAEA
jgi:hypothetical protein